MISETTKYRRLKSQKFNESGEEGIDCITCKICGSKFRQLNHRHLKTHNISTKKYKEIYKVIKLTSKNYSMKREETFLNRYGCKNQFGREEIKEKIDYVANGEVLLNYSKSLSSTQLTERSQKIKETCLKKFGYKTNLRIPGVLEKSIATIKAKAEKRKNTKEYKRSLIRNKIRRSVSKSIHHSLKKKDKGTFKILKFTREQLMDRLNETMPDGYIWEDYLENKLDIDHIIPISLYDFTTYEDIEFQKCYSLKNLRLLPKRENILKSNKLEMNLVEQFDLYNILPEGIGITYAN